LARIVNVSSKNIENKSVSIKPGRFWIIAVAWFNFWIYNVLICVDKQFKRYESARDLVRFEVIRSFKISLRFK